jgi:hypothetical protein
LMLMSLMKSIPQKHQQGGAQTLRESVLASFSHPRCVVAERLGGYSEREWRNVLTWLDTSGLALYLLDHLTAIGLQDLLPASVLERLQQNLADNTARNASLLAETAEINLGLQREGLLFANLKGITLSPESVPDPALRCQLDLDFLVCAKQADVAARVLSRSGYALHCVSGDTWEFKAGSSEVASLKDLYKIKSQRAAELHMTTLEVLLKRVQLRSFSGATFPVLSPVDLYLAQAVHLFGHICSPFTRASWLLEYRRHMLARAEDEVFWDELERRALEEPKAAVALSVVTLLVIEVFGDSAPQVLSLLIASHVSPAVQLWVRLYGQSALVADFPGTKLYLLLEQELLRDSAKPGNLLRRSLLPLRPPPLIAHGEVDESLSLRVRRWRVQAGYTAFRLRFHCVEGLRYLLESSRFRRLLTGLAH